MADRFSLEQSKRFFAVIAVGGTLGAIFGPWLAGTLAEPLGTPSLLLVSAGFLVLALAAAAAVARLQPAPTKLAGSGDLVAEPASVGTGVIGGSAWDGLRSIFRSRYLLGISGFALIVAVMATFLYFTRLQMVAELEASLDTRTALFANIDPNHSGHDTHYATHRNRPSHEASRRADHACVPPHHCGVWLHWPGGFRFARGADRFRSRFPSRAEGDNETGARDALHDRPPEEKYKSKAFIDTAVYRGGDSVTAWMEGAIGRLGMG